MLISGDKHKFSFHESTGALQMMADLLVLETNNRWFLSHETFLSVVLGRSGNNKIKFPCHTVSPGKSEMNDVCLSMSSRSQILSSTSWGSNTMQKLGNMITCPQVAKL